MADTTPVAAPTKTVGDRTRELLAAGVPAYRIAALFKEKTGRDLKDVPDTWPLHRAQAGDLPAESVDLADDPAPATAAAPLETPYKDVWAPGAKLVGMVKGAAQGARDSLAGLAGDITGGYNDFLASVPGSGVPYSSSVGGPNALQKAAKERKADIERKAKQPFTSALVQDVQTTLSALPAIVAQGAEGIVYPASIPADADPYQYMKQQGEELGKAVTTGVGAELQTMLSTSPLTMARAEPFNAALTYLPLARGVGGLAATTKLGQKGLSQLRRAAQAVKDTAPVRAAAEMAMPLTENVLDPARRMAVDSTYSTNPRMRQLLAETTHRPAEVAGGVTKVLSRENPPHVPDLATRRVTKPLEGNGPPLDTDVHGRVTQEHPLVGEEMGKLPEIQFTNRDIPPGTPGHVEPAQNSPYYDIARDVVGKQRTRPSTEGAHGGGVILEDASEALESVVAEINHVLEGELGVTELLRVGEIRQKVAEKLVNKSRAWGQEGRLGELHKIDETNKYLDALTTFNPSAANKVPTHPRMAEALKEAVAETVRDLPNARKYVVEVTKQRLAQIAEKRKMQEALRRDSEGLESFLLQEEQALVDRKNPDVRETLNTAEVPSVHDVLTIAGDDIFAYLARISRAEDEAYATGTAADRALAGLPPSAAVEAPPVLVVPPRGPIPPSTRKAGASALEQYAARALDPAKRLKEFRAIRERIEAAATQQEKLAIAKEIGDLQNVILEEERAFRTSLAEMTHQEALAAYNARRAAAVAAEEAALGQRPKNVRGEALKRLYNKVNTFKQLDEALTGSSAWVDPVLHDAITTYAKARNAMMEVTKASWVLSQTKKNLTSRNLVSSFNNIGSNLLLQAMRTGDPLGGAAQAARAYVQLRRWEKGLDSEKWRALAKTGVFDATQLDKDFGITRPLQPSAVAAKAQEMVTGRKAGPPGVVGKAADVTKGVMDSVTKGIEDFYKMGDNFFKAGEASVEFDKVLGKIDALEPGEWLELPDQSGNVHRLLRRTDSTNTYTAYAPDGSTRVYFDGNRAGLVQMAAEAAAKSASDLFFDYGKTPKYAQIMKYQPLLGIASPFYTWAIKALDIPGVKKGLGAHTLLGRPTYSTNSTRILRAQAQEQVALGARRALMLSSMRAALEDQKSQQLLEATNYLPNEVKLGVARLASNPEYVEVAKMGNWNYLNASLDLFKLMSAGALKLSSAMGGEGDLDPTHGGETRLPMKAVETQLETDISALQDPDIAADPDTVAVLTARIQAARKQLATPQADESTRDVARMRGMGKLGGMQEVFNLMGMAGSPLSDLLASNKRDQVYGQDVQLDDVLKQFGTAVLGGTYYKLGEAGIVAAAGPGSRWSTYRFSATPETREDVARFIIRKLTGMGWMRVGPKDTDKYFDRAKTEWKARLGIPKMKREVESLSEQGRRDEATALENEMTRMSDIVADEIGKMQDDYYKMKEVLGVRQDERKGADKF